MIGLGSTYGHCMFWARTPFGPDASKKIPTNYCKLTLYAIFTNLIGSLHNILQIFFQPIFISSQLLWMLGINLPPKTDIFVARLEPTTKRLEHLNTVICERPVCTSGGEPFCVTGVGAHTPQLAKLGDLHSSALQWSPVQFSPFQCV